VARAVLSLLQKDDQYDASHNLATEILTQIRRPGSIRPTTPVNDDRLLRQRPVLRPRHDP